MNGDHPKSAKDAFRTVDLGTVPGAPEVPEVPERIRNDAPNPVLRPGGSWAAWADSVDQTVRERQDAAKAKSEWRTNNKKKTGRGRFMGFNHSAKGDE